MTAPNTVLIDYDPLQSFLATGLDGTLMRALKYKKSAPCIPAVVEAKVAAAEEDEDDTRFRGCASKLQFFKQTRQITIMSDSRDDRDLWRRMSELTEFPVDAAVRAVTQLSQHMVIAHAMGLRGIGSAVFVLIDDHTGRASATGAGLRSIGTVEVLLAAANAGVIEDPIAMRDQFDRLREFNDALPEWHAPGNPLTDAGQYGQ